VCAACDRWRRAATYAPTPTVDGDRQRVAAAAELTVLRAKYKESLGVIGRMESELEIARSISSHDIAPIDIVPSVGSKGTNEAAVILCAGDWHSEEIVDPATLNYVNEHNIEIHQRRQQRFWQSSLKLFKLIEAGVKVPTIVLALLGDFITNDIHDADSAENNALLPVPAMMMIENELMGGINFLLNHTKSNIIVDCHSGNHARTTKKVHIANEDGHSLEYYAYNHLAREFRNEPRVTFRVNRGYHSFLDVYSTKLRIHHGHAVKYGGGVGGLTIPANKAIAQWNKETRNVDIDIFGHFHQSFDGGTFIANGSMIGYNAFAKFIKGDYEVPQQTFFVIDKKHGKTFRCPIYLETKEKK
jgi:hypothetical protein